MANFWILLCVGYFANGIKNVDFLSSNDLEDNTSDSSEICNNENNIVDENIDNGLLRSTEVVCSNSHDMEPTSTVPPGWRLKLILDSIGIQNSVITLKSSELVQHAGTVTAISVLKTTSTFDYDVPFEHTTSNIIENFICETQCPAVNQTIEVNQSRINITWPLTYQGNDAVSNPLCLSKCLKIIKRRCEDDWKEPPICNSVQQPINPCPSDLNPKDGQFCYKIIEKTKFPPTCPYPGPLGWDEYIGLNLFNNKPVWMPLKRTNTTQYGFDMFRYNEISNKYNTPFQICTQSCRTLFYQGTFHDKECLVYHNSTHVEAVSCDAQYSAVCLYKALHHQKSSFCQQTYPKCRPVNYKPGFSCFCETTRQIVAEHLFAEFLLPYQNLLFTNSCRIGLENNLSNSSMPFIWANSREPITYANWASNVDFSYQYGVLTSNGWILSNKSSNCSIFKIDLPEKEGKLTLYIENIHYKLVIKNYKSFLSINNSDPLVYCFTDADAKSIIYRVDNFIEASTTNETYIIQFPPINIDQSGPGHYWCQAFLHPNLTVVTTEPRIMQNFSAEYVVLLKLKDYEDKLSFYPLTPENLETLQNLFRNELPNTISFYPRIFKMNGIDEDRKEINITFHLTSSEASNTEAEFNALKAICMQQSMFEFLDFRNVHYCPNGTTRHGGQTVVWKKVGWKQTVSPLLNGQIAGHCVTANATLIQRTCIGNFIDGVYWSNIDEMCQFYPESHLTQKLINISTQNDDETLNNTLTELHNISNEFESFNTLDLVLAANFINDIALKRIDLDLLAGILSNLMKISRVVLLSAQLNFKATDVLLQAVDVALKNGDFGEWKKPNFAIKSLDISKGIIGLQLQNCSAENGCDLVPIINPTVLYNLSLIALEHVNTAVSLSTDLHKQIMNYSSVNANYTPKLIVSVFYGSQLFVELKNSKSSNLVIGLLLPGFTEPFEGPISIYYYTTYRSLSLEYNCSYWKFNKTYSGSWNIENTDQFNEALTCEFYHLTHFRTPYSLPKGNVKADNLETCIPSDEVGKKCFTADQYEEELQLCKMIDVEESLNGFCLTNNLTAIPTNCFTNFTNEAPILEILDNCSVHELSNLMKNVLQDMRYMNDETYDSILDLLLTMTTSYENISDFELLFVASFLKVISNKTIDLLKLAGVVNNLMQVPKSVMYNAQLKFRVVDILLSTIELALANGECGEWKTEKFAIICLNIDERYAGVLLKNCSENLQSCDLEIINRTNVPHSKTPNDEAIHAVIILSDSLHDQILNYSKTHATYVPKLMVSIYYTSSIFFDLEATPEVSNFVFGVLLPEFNQEFLGPLMIYYLKDSDFIQYNCSYWKFDDNSYGTWVVESSLLSNEAVVCEFFHLTNFAIPTRILNDTYFPEDVFFGSTKPVALLDNRISNFSSQSSNKEENLSLDKCTINNFMTSIVSPMYSCSKHKIFYHYSIMKNAKISANAFSSVSNTVNVGHLIGNIKSVTHINEKSRELSDNFSSNVEMIFSALEMMRPSVETLELLASIVSLCMEVSDDTILEAQLAGRIVHNVDRIVQNFNITVQVKESNILFITISKDDVEHFQGFSLTKDRDVICIYQPFSFDEANVVVSVMLSEELRKQISKANSNVIFAVFYNEVLFPSIKQIKLPIIEVLIPKLNNELKGNITIKYQNSHTGKCSYWDHEMTGNAVTKPGYWKIESDATIDGNVVTCNFQHVTHFALITSTQNITTDLEQILASDLSGLEKLKQVETITASNLEYLVAVDIYLISQIITNSLVEGAITSVISNIVSILFMVPRDVLRESQEVHSATDIILYAIDEMARMSDDFGIHHQNFSLIVKNIAKANLTGLTLSRCEGYTCNVTELDTFVNISDYLDDESISAMVLFSEELVAQIRNCTANPKVAISIFYSDALFNEVDNTRNTTKIFGIIFPGLTEELNGSVSVIYNIGTASSRESNQCAYWQYKADPTGNIDNATLGKWINDTNDQREKFMAICSYSHVTHFGMLLANNDDYDDDPILDLITDIGCILSLFGIFLILITAMMFKKWRQNTGNKILVNFSAAISIKIITLYISVYIKRTTCGISCTITGVALHYAILSECTWMLTVAILQFKRFVEVLGGPPKYVLVKALVCGWIFPVIPVICVVTIDPDNYEKGVANLCYPSNLGLYLGVWLPVLIILTINCVIFIFIIYNVFHKKTEYIDVSNHEMLFQWRLALLLFFMLGLNWAFGFVGQIKGNLLFTYLYSVTASLQGFVLFLIFIVFNKSTRFLYSQAIKHWFYARGIFKVWQSKSTSNSKY